MGLLFIKRVQISCIAWSWVRNEPSEILHSHCHSDNFVRHAAMRFIGSLIDKLQRHPKRVVFPEGTEPRMLQAARQFYSLRLGAPILLGDRPKSKRRLHN